jgi:cytochrome c-type biogenesis protein CcmH/NrfF
MALDAVPAGKPFRDALYNDITANMACLCGCGTTLKTCPHENCSFAVPARKEIRGFVDQGMGHDEIRGKMVALHGEAILAQPIFFGFGVLGWVTPFAAILAVGYMVVLVAQKWTASKAGAPPKKEAGGTSEPDPYLGKMRDELKKFED